MMNFRMLIALTFALFFIACSTDADDEYVFEAAVVCPDNARGTFVDERDGREYKYTTIGNRKWMAQNLNFVADSGSNCSYKENDCADKGRTYGENVYESVCPKGWHIPNMDEWQELVQNMGGDTIVGARLKSIEGWERLDFSEIGPNGTDDCGFSVVPTLTSYSSNDGFSAVLWLDNKNAMHFQSNWNHIAKVSGEYSAFSVRCVEGR